MPGKLSISQNREYIDKLDDELLSLLNKRGELSLKIREIKKFSGEEIYDPEREEQIIKRLCKKNKGPLSDENIRELYLNILKIMKELPEK